MRVFNYGINQIEVEAIETPTEVNEVNKLNGGLWACPETDYFSDWFVLLLYLPMMAKPDTTLGGNYIELSPNASILTLDVDNYHRYLVNGKLDMDQVMQYDVLHFTEALVDQVEAFESYYVESYHILNKEAIKSIQREPIDFFSLMSPTFKQQTLDVFMTLKERVLKTSFCQSLHQ